MNNNFIIKTYKQHPILCIVALAIFSRVLFFSFYPVFTFLFSYFGFETDGEVWNSNSSIVGYWLGFDTEHYLHIAQNGYYGKITAFFPLYPLLMKTISLTGISLEWSGIIISQTFFVLAVIMFYKLLTIENIKPIFPILLLLFSPITIFFTTIYTESLFLFLSVTVFYFIRSKKWGYAALFIGFASLTRNSGAILFLILAMEYLRCKGWRYNLKQDILLLGIGVSMFLSYPLYLFIRYGEPTMYINVQSIFWERHFTFPWMSIYYDILKIAEYPAVYMIAIFNIGFFLMAVWTVLSKSRLHYTYLIFVLFSIIMPLLYPVTMGDMPYTTSLSRYVLVLFPIYMFLGVKINNPLVKIIIVEVSIGIMIMFANSFLGKQFIG